MSNLQMMKHKFDNTKKLTDEDEMIFGQHKGTKMKDVPAGYLMCLERQD